MAKKRKRSVKRAAKAAARVAETSGPGTKTSEPDTNTPDTKASGRTEMSGPDAAAREPTFWFDFEVTWAKLVLGRVVVFTLLAIDALMQVSHAPRYSAGDFNVAQLPLLDGLGPTRALYSSAQLLLAYLLVFVACGVATRIVLPIAAALYGWLYFGSQLDSYQHHYLVWLILIVACGVPWQRPADATATTRVRSWALRLMLVQLGIVYLWAAISKLDGAWLDGSTLALQLRGTVRKVLDATIGVGIAAWLVVITELVLAFTVWWRRAWPIAAPLGILLHVGIVMTGLEIGLFAFLMLGLYIFVVPDRVWTWLAARRPLATLAGVARVIADWFDGAAAWTWFVIATGLGIALLAASRFEHAWLVGLTLAGLLVGGLVTVLVTRHRRISIAALASAHLLALVTWTVVDRTTATAADYYRLWGGSARRFGDAKTAEAAYRKMIEVAPREGGGHYQLGRLLLQRNASEEGLAALHTAQDLEPMKARAYLAEARWLAANGRRDEALAKAREATIVEPNDAEARAFLGSLLPAQR